MELINRFKKFFIKLFEGKSDDQITWLNCTFESGVFFDQMKKSGWILMSQGNFKKDPVQKYSYSYWNEFSAINDFILQEQTKQEVLLQKIRRYVSHSGEFSELEGKKLSTEQILDFFLKDISDGFSLDCDSYFLEEILELRRSNRLERSYKKIKAEFIKRKLRSIFDFRDIFRKVYSFHFKNLDDESDLAGYLTRFSS